LLIWSRFLYDDDRRQLIRRTTSWALWRRARSHEDHYQSQDQGKRVLLEKHGSNIEEMNKEQGTRNIEVRRNREYRSIEIILSENPMRISAIPIGNNN
jgi:hypothetical protein